MRCSPPDDPHAITAAFTYDSYAISWVFSAVPGDLTLTQIATSPAAWRADVPSESGATRSYFGSSSTGPFVAPLNFGHLDADANGFIETERNGTRRYFDTNGKLTKVEYAGGVQTYTWDGANSTIEADSTHPPSRMRVTTSSGHVTNAAIDSYIGGNWVTVAEVDATWSGSAITALEFSPDGRTLSFTYYATGDLATYEDCSGRVYTARYYAGEATYGAVYSIIDPEGVAHLFDSEDATVGYGQAVLYQDPRVGVSRWWYDNGALTYFVNPLGNSTYFRWPSAADLPPSGPSSITDALNRSTYFQYDDYGNAIAITDPLQHTTYSEYDGFLLVSETDPLDHSRYYEYNNDYGLLIAQTDAGGNTRYWNYDDSNREISHIDELGCVTYTNYTSSGLGRKVIDPLLHVTYSIYDQYGHNIAIQDPLNHTVYFEYNSMGLLTKTTDPLGHTTQRGYTEGGLVNVELNQANTPTYYLSGKRSQEQARWNFPWRRLRGGAGGGCAAAA